MSECATKHRMALLIVSAPVNPIIRLIMKLGPVSTSLCHRTIHRLPLLLHRTRCLLDQSSVLIMPVCGKLDCHLDLSLTCGLLEGHVQHSSDDDEAVAPNPLAIVFTGKRTQKTNKTSANAPGKTVRKRPNRLADRAIDYVLRQYMSKQNAEMGESSGKYISQPCILSILTLNCRPHSIVVR